jgi:hypothetical protein
MRGVEVKLVSNDRAHGEAVHKGSGDGIGQLFRVSKRVGRGVGVVFYVLRFARVVCCCAIGTWGTWPVFARPGVLAHCTRRSCLKAASPPEQLGGTRGGMRRGERAGGVSVRVPRMHCQCNRLRSAPRGEILGMLCDRERDTLYPSF